MRLVVNDMREGYREIIEYVRAKGQKSSPRGFETREVLGAQIIVEDLRDTLPVGINRKISLPFAALEAAQLVAGVTMVDLSLRVNPTMERFLDTAPDGTSYFHGAYGPRIRESLVKVVDILDVDRDSRQALVNIWTQDRDLHVMRRDVPCTVVLHFMIRKNRLILHTTMRSNDVWWGLAYDVFQFTQLQWTVARSLGVEPGQYFHNANSLHAYVKDYDAMDQLTRPEEHYLNHPLGFGHSEMLDPFEASGTKLQLAQDRAYDILKGHGNFTNATESERWYLEYLHER